MILTPAQEKVFEKALAAVAAVLPKLTMLQQLAEGDPHLAERIAPLVSLKDFLTTQSTLALEIAAAERNGGGEDSE